MDFFVNKTLRLALMASLISCTLVALDEVGIGQEYVTPLSYPKFSLGADHSISRHFRSFADSSLRIKLPNRFGAALSFEAGLVKYLNAGALVTFSFSQVREKSEPIDLRLGLFIKPLLPLGERFALFGRAALGTTLPFPGNLSPINFLGEVSDDFKTSYLSIYKGQRYQGSAYGGFGSAALGVEFFPISRLGLALEWGIRSDFITMSRKHPLISGVPEAKEGAPQSFNYMMYEMPLMLTLHAIL